MDWLEYIFPLIVFLFWIFGGLFKKGDDEHETPSPRRNPRPTSQDDDVARRIQEEIRRKIAERRSTQGESPTAQQPTPEFRREQPRSVPMPEPARRQVQSQQQSAGSVQQTQTHHLDEMQAQIQRNREEAKRSREKLLKTRREHRSEKNRQPAASQPAGSLRGDVLNMLGNRSLAQRAFVMQDIFGTPVGLRRQGAIVPPWEQ